MASSLIVGYSTTTTIGEGSFTQITPVFTKVSDSTKLSLADLDFTPTRDDNIQIFDQDGNVADTITYCRRGKSGSYTYYWESDNLGEVEDYDFPRGSSLWLNTADPINVTQSGAVANDATVVDLPGDGGFAQTGNCTPVAVKLGDLVFSDLSRDDNIQIFDGDGNVADTITYCRRGKSGSYTYYWESDLEGELDPDVYTFAPGQTFWVNTANSGTLTIPAPIK